MNQQKGSGHSVSARVCFSDVAQVVEALRENLKTGFVVSGIALHLTAVPASDPKTRAKATQPAENGRITARQLKAIFGIGKSRGMSNKDIKDYAQEMFGKLPDYLTKQEASVIIDNLKGGS